jgi:nucleotide-binding universal stress UspA family protein
MILMAKTKILIPLDGTGKSLHSIAWLKKYFGKEDAEVTLLNVIVTFLSSEVSIEHDIKAKEQESMDMLENAMKELEGYEVQKKFVYGFAPDVIMETAREGGFDMIIMTRSTVTGLARIIGSVTSKVVRSSEVAVVIVPE